MLYKFFTLLYLGYELFRCSRWSSQKRSPVEAYWSTFTIKHSSFLLSWNYFVCAGKVVMALDSWSRGDVIDSQSWLLNFHVMILGKLFTICAYHQAVYFDIAKGQWHCVTGKVMSGLPVSKMAAYRWVCDLSHTRTYYQETDQLQLPCCY